MTDTILYTFEERLEAEVWVHERIRNNSNMVSIQKAFTVRFGKKAPSRSNLYLWKQKAFENGSVLDKRRSGKLKIRREPDLNHLRQFVKSIIKKEVASKKIYHYQELPTETLKEMAHFFVITFVFFYKYDN